MDSLTLTVTPTTTTDGETGYTVRIVIPPAEAGSEPHHVRAGLLAAGVTRADSAILSALYKLLGVELSPAITFTAADVTFFLPSPLVAEPNTFAASLAAKLEGTKPSKPVTPLASPVTPVRPAPAALVRQVPMAPSKYRGCPGGAAAGAASYVTHQEEAFYAPPAEEDDLEVEMDPDFCLCITQAGTQCSRRPVKGKSVCAQHGRKKRR